MTENVESGEAKSGERFVVSKNRKTRELPARSRKDKEMPSISVASSSDSRHDRICIRDEITQLRHSQGATPRPRSCFLKS